MARAMYAAPASRIEPGLEGTPCTAADREHRSIANLVEVLTRGYCGRNGITIQEQRALLLEDDQKSPHGTSK